MDESKRNFSARKGCGENPLISVITLSYNSVHLMDTIQSVLEQSYPKIEYIIVDDGSHFFDKDAIDSYIREHKSDNIFSYKIIINSQNLGTVKASNIAIKNSAGEYLFNLAADDVFFHTNTLEKWVGEFQKRNALVITGLSAVYDESLNNFLQILPEKKEISLLLKKEPQKLFRRLCYSNIVYGCCTARSRLCVEKYGLYDEHYRLIEDYPYALALSRKGAVIECWEQPVIKYRRGGVSSAFHFSPSYAKDSDWIVHREILPYVKNPWKVHLHYRLWRHKRRRSAQFYQQLERINNHTQKLWLLLRFPFLALHYIRGRLLCRY